MRSRALLTTLALAWLALAPPAVAGKLHVLMAVDHAAPRIGGDITGMPVFLAFRANIPENLWVYDELPDGPISETSVLEAIRRLEVDPDDAVLFYYIGHGAYDGRLGTYMTPSGGEGQLLSATRVLQEVKARGPRLAVVVYDCCNRERGLVTRVVPAPMAGPPPNQISPLFRSLFFDVGGSVLVVSSSPNEYALVRAAGVGAPADDPEDQVPPGSIFTTAFAQTLEANARRPMRWSDAVRLTQARLDELFTAMKRLSNPLTLDGGEVVQQDRQTIQVRFFR